MRHGGKILTEQLEAQGVDTVFMVPGESFLPVLDGLHDSNQIRSIICRQEGGASMMAEAYGKITGRPGVCMVTRGPGAANAMSGLHVAQQDSTPMVTFVGLPDQETEDRDAFQEIDTKGVFSSFVKWSSVIRDVRRVPEYVSRAFHVASSGRPGPVVLGLPEDMLGGKIDVPAALAARVAGPAPAPADMAALDKLLAKAKRPIMIVGGPGWSADIQTRLQAWAKKFDLPVATAFRFQDYFDNRHPNYVGHAAIGIDGKLGEALKNADLLIVVGARLGEITTQGYGLLAIPNPVQTFVHIHPSPDELGQVYRPEIAIASTAANFVAALEKFTPPKTIAWTGQRETLRQAFEAYAKPAETPGDVKLEQVISQVSQMLPDDAIVTNGAGNYAAFLHRYFTYKGFRTQLAPTSGSMGYGLPAAIAAKQAFPHRQVVAFAGDGCFLMTGQEMATAMQYSLPLVVIVANNGMYGTIRMHQERHFPGRVVATTLVNPDFAAFAKSFGAHGERVERTADFKGAFQRALDCGRPALIELKIDPEALTPKQTLSQIRAGGA
jgi:acetolactate synthase I/II/III large subunit